MKANNLTNDKIKITNTNKKEFLNKKIKKEARNNLSLEIVSCTSNHLFLN